MKRNVFSTLDDLAKGISDLRSALSPLLAIATGSPASGRAAQRRPRKGRGHPAKSAASTVRRKNARVATRRQKPVSAVVKAKRILQGRYLGAIRPLSKANRAKVKVVQAKQGHEAAIRVARSLKK